jgi:predicted ATPase
MKIEALRIKNFKAFRDASMKNIPNLCILIGANGSGKSTLFSVFGFLKEAMTTNVTTALAKFGGGRGFHEVRSRNATEDIEIELKFRIDSDSPLATYFLSIGEQNGNAVVTHEILKYRRGSWGKPWHFLDFANGEGSAVTNEVAQVDDESQLQREVQSLKSPDILAIKGLAQFHKFPAVVALGNLIENWHISDFHINKARPEAEAGYAEHLSTEGENLALVTQFLYQKHRPIFDKICQKLTQRVPGITKVDAKTTEEGRVLLRFQDGAFVDPFLARHVSDGTIKMFAYLVLFYDPQPHPLLCVEEPENQLYPKLLWELAEELRSYAKRGGQVFVSTHSPDFLNAANLEEVFWLVKSKGSTKILCAAQDKQIAAYMEDGDKLGQLWKQGLFPGVDPQ